jgi:hypothetical protein
MIFDRADNRDAEHRSEQYFCHYRCFWKMFSPKVAKATAEGRSPTECGVCGKAIGGSGDAASSIDPCGLLLTLDYVTERPMSSASPLFCHLECFRKVVEAHLAVPVGLGSDVGAT